MAEFITPDFLKGESYDEVLGRMLKRIPDNISKEENGWVCDLFAPVALEHARAVQFVLTEAVKNIIPKYSYGDILIGHGENRGIFRRGASFAEAVLKVTGMPKTVIPKGFQFSTAADFDSAGIVFECVNETEISESGEACVNVKCVTPGNVGNVAADKIMLMVKPMKGIVSVKNEAPAYGGFEEETEDSLRQRIAEYDTMQGLSFVGSPEDYRRWALEVDGVGSASVIPANDDTGLVTIVLTDLNGMPAGEEICTNVYEHIMRPDSLYERLAPVNALLSVVPARDVKISVSVTVQLVKGYLEENVKNTFILALKEYFAIVSDEIKYVEVGALLINTEGVLDYSGLTINGGAENIKIALGDVPVVESVAFSI